MLSESLQRSSDKGTVFNGDDNGDDHVGTDDDDDDDTNNFLEVRSQNRSLGALFVLFDLTVLH